MITWVIVFGFVLLMFVAPNAALEIARIVGFYALFRVGWLVFFYLIGVEKILRTEREISSAKPAVAPKIHHLAIIPNYKEPAEVLAKTLDAISKSHGARDRMTVVLAMEAADSAAEKTAAELVKNFSNRFTRVLVTYHPANLPGEVPGKAANETWAGRKAKTELVDRLGIDINSIIVTSCDADSIFHPEYFNELERMFTSEPHPDHCIWQAPVMFDSNIWNVPSTIRLLTYFINAAQLSELTSPLSFAMPISSYSLSLKLIDEVGYWDPVVIPDDYHMYLRCMFALNGNLRLVPIFLPIRGETVNGQTRWQAWKTYYKQKVRHSWGSQDTAYILQQWNKNPGTPFGSKFSRLSKMFFDHNFTAFLPVIIILGTGLAIYLKGEPILTLAANYVFPPVVLISNGITVLTTLMLWLVEHWRCARTKDDWSPVVLLIELVTWAIMPFASVILLGIPILHAQTKMMLGSPLVFARTPKGSNTTSESVKS